MTRPVALLCVLMADAFSQGRALAGDHAPRSTWLTYEEQQVLGETGLPPEQGLPLGWGLFYPGFSAQPVFNSNVFATSTKSRAAAGVRVQPRLQAIIDQEVQTTVLNASVDGQFYPGLEFVKRYLTGQVSGIHSWRPAPGWEIGVSGDFTREMILNSANQAQLLATKAAAFSRQLGPAFYRDYTLQEGYNVFGADAFIERKIERWFLRATGGWSHLQYDTVPQNPLLNALNYSEGKVQLRPVSLSLYWDNQSRYYGIARGGYILENGTKLFVEGGVNRRVYQKSENNSVSRQFLIGMDLAANEDVHAEAYVGQQRYFLPDAVSGQPLVGSAVSAPAVGGKLSVGLLEDLKLRFNAYHTMNASRAVGSYAALYTGPSSFSSLQLSCDSEYHAAPRLWVTFGVEHSAQNWSGASGFLSPSYSGGQTRTLISKLGMVYDLAESTTLTANYQFIAATGCANACQYPWTIADPAMKLEWLRGNLTGSYSQSMLSVGLKYHY